MVGMVSAWRTVDVVHGLKFVLQGGDFADRCTTYCGTLWSMSGSDLEHSQLDRFLNSLHSTMETTAGTSIRVPENLREAANLAAELGYAVSLTELTVKGLRDVLEAISWRLVLDEHYRRHPQARPSLVEVAKAAAAIDDNPIAEEPELIEQAAAWIVEHRPDADADEVLWLAMGMSLARSIA